jgi:hypothetical protein
VSKNEMPGRGSNRVEDREVGYPWGRGGDAAGGGGGGPEEVEDEGEREEEREGERHGEAGRQGLGHGGVGWSGGKGRRRRVQGAGRGGGGIFMERNNGGRAAAAVWALWLGVPRFRNLDPFGIMAAGLDPTVHDTLPLVARLAARVARPSDAPC